MNLTPNKNIVINKIRHKDIDIAKGLAILLVVFGHIVARQTPIGNEWYAFLKTALYSFHMGFFMFLSGVAFYSTLRKLNNINQFILAFKKRFARLMPSYFLFAILIFFGKLIAQQFGHVDNPVNDIYSLVDIALYPMQSIASFLWYIYVLFIISIVTLAAFSLLRGRLFILLIIGFTLLFIPKIDLLAIGQITKYFFFFIAGTYAMQNWDLYTKYVDKIWSLSLLLMATLLTFGFFTGAMWIIISIISIPALHGVCRKDIYGKKLLLYIGSMTFPIYLMNTIAIGSTKAIMLKFINWDYNNFYIFIPLLFSAGVILPIFVKKYIFSRVNWLDKITS